MRIPRIYCPDILVNQDLLELDNMASSHLCKVLRLTSGDSLLIFDGKGNSFTAIMETASHKSATIQITGPMEENTESKLILHLGLGMSKGDHMDYAIQKAVEVGVSHITPLITKFSVIKLDEKRQQKKLQHWLGIIIHACEQSGRTRLPVLNPITPLVSWLEHDAERKIVFVPNGAKTLAQLDRTSSVSVLIGPEGGLCLSEVNLAANHEFKQVRLGPRTLRTETAAAVACGAIQTLWGDYTN